MITLRVLGTSVTLLETLRVRAEKELGIRLVYQVHDVEQAQRIAVMQPDSYDLYDQWFHNVDFVWPARAIQPRKIGGQGERRRNSRHTPCRGSETISATAILVRRAAMRRRAVKVWDFFTVSSSPFPPALPAGPFPIPVGEGGSSAAAEG